MAYFFAVKTSPNMIGLTVQNIIIKKQLKTKFKVPGVLFCTIFKDCLNTVGWFTDVPPLHQCSITSNGVLFFFILSCLLRLLAISYYACFHSFMLA